MNASARATRPLPTAITPGVRIDDPQSAYWVRQAILRVRREIAWCWHQRPSTPAPGGVLPPLADAAAEHLDLVRFEHHKREFFADDVAAGYLSGEIDALPRAESDSSRWAFMARSLELDDAAQFVLGLALAARLDGALAPIFAACLNDLSRPYATLALAQRLWDDPVAVMRCTNPDHPLYRYGLLAASEEPGNPWHRPLDMPAVVAEQLIDPQSPLPYGLTSVDPDGDRGGNRSADLLVARLRAKEPGAVQIVPLLGPRAAAYPAWAAALGQRVGRGVVAWDQRLVDDAASLRAAACVCWLCQYDPLLPEGWNTGRDDEAAARLAALSVPLRWYAPVHDAAQLQQLPPTLLTPPLRIPPLDFQQRRRKLRAALGGAADAISSTVDRCARRFRFEEQVIERLAASFRSAPLTAENLLAACANEATCELGNLAQPVTPRFLPGELVLPSEQARDLDEVRHAMQALTVVHYHWGTAKAWSECGLSVLFSGAPGTGKTMAAETLAAALDLPMYRIDLSQVVNKYIGETEKNLKRIFDAAELSDCILFFDEADALFGKRTDVKDAHDRFANIEISYLLERMERFKGLAILATNRRKDLDEAFLRRLRYVIEFPVPGVDERERIWRYVFPQQVDVQAIDFRYLARQFQLAGGHIRSIAFNACLHAAEANDGCQQPSLDMDAVLQAVRRELSKLNRSSSNEVFGSYCTLLEQPA